MACFERDDCVGKSGHGDVWQDATLCLERAARTHFLLDLDLNRFTSYALELATTSASPSGKIASWGFDRGRLIQGVRILRGY